MPFSSEHISHFKTLASIKTPRVISAVAWMLIVAVTSTTLFLIFTPWVQTTSGPGVVTALDPNDRVQEINALVSGRIESWFVRDGSIVEKGDPIVRIVDNDPLLLQRLDAEREQILARIRAAETAVATAELDRDRTFQLYEEGLAARRDYEQTQIRLEDLRARAAEATAALTRLDTQISRQSAQLVRAPRDGMILSLNAGDISTFIDAGQSIATFLPAEAERAVEIFVDGRDVALVQPGDPVRLMFEGWPAIQVSGWPDVSLGTFAGEVVAVDPSAQPDGRFRVLVTEDRTGGEVWPDRAFVRFGASARGWVLLETVPLGFELWRQLNNFPPQFPSGTMSPAEGAGA